MKYGLIGEKLSHSYSADIHPMISGNPYELRDLKEEELADFFKKREFEGINITIPYKEKSISFLDRIDPAAKRIGSVNTVVNEDGFLVGYNTDEDGFIRMMKRYDIRVKGKKVLILGSGGTAKTVKSALVFLGAKEIYTVSRKTKAGCISYAQAEERFDIQLIVNTTPCGMFPDIGSKPPLDLKRFPYLETCVDVIYNPLKTQFLSEAKKRGIRAVSGLSMLVEQACSAEERFLGRKFSEGFREGIYRQTLLKKANIVLIGMPMSGKTTVSYHLAKALKAKRADTDEAIEKKTGVKISDLIEKSGIEKFRDLETEEIRNLSEQSGWIISTGGGSLTREENIPLLCRNSVVIFLNRDLALLKRTNSDSRPLLKEEGALEKLYRERFETYRVCADIEIPNNGSVMETVNMILERLL